jgi:hypothetical protein
MILFVNAQYLPAILADDRWIHHCLWAKKKTLILELQKSFERIDEIQDSDPNRVTELEIPKEPHQT